MFNCKIGAAAADNTQPANTNSVFAWGAMASSGSVAVGQSYIATTSSTVTRSAEMLKLQTLQN